MPQSFYARGLRFSCKRCSVCCRRDPGYVFLSRDDAGLLASRLKMGYSSFVERCCRWVTLNEKPLLSLRETPAYDCVLWDRGCTVYQDRPVQCRTFPFWKANLASRESWDALDCPGVNEGELRSAEYIDRCLAGMADWKVLTRGPL
ncbi:MAG: YkgJ family cysteine cluster protein [Treponema sp.]|nr:YkgJ family cysteine cluster protein [Treponema sp.]